VVRGELIHDIVPTAECARLYSAARAVDLSAEHCLMPGLVNAHTHLALNFLRGVGDDQPLDKWLSESIWPTEARLVDADFVRAGTRAACAELIRGGVTTVNDMYWFPGAAAEALEACGMRALVAMVVLEFPSKYAGGAAAYFAEGLRIREEWARRCAGAGGSAAARRVRFGLGPHAPYTVSDESFARVRELSAAHGLRVHVHLHETAGEVLASRTGGAEGTPSSKHMSEQRLSPLDNLARLGLLNERLVAVHMTALSDADVAAVAAARASVVHCPSSNLKLASGFCPVAKLAAAGANVALGTDSASSNNALDMFAEMKTAALLAMGVAGDATAVPAWQALRMATLNGARALGIEAEAGSLEVGKQADMVAVRLAGVPELAPLFSVVSHLVYAAGREHVTDVWCGGQQLLDARRLTTISEADVLRDCAEQGARVAEGRARDPHLLQAIGAAFRRPGCCS
jgi:5-methylthioadenosine/S-adenosylhomocysteine deaminase